MPRWLRLFPLCFVEWYAIKFSAYKEIVNLEGGRYYVLQGPGTRIAPVRVIMIEINVNDRHWYPDNEDDSLRSLNR